MANASSPGDLDSMARQYWDTWSGLMGMGPAGSGTWTGLGGMAPGQPAPAAFDCYARMQEVAAQFADGGGSAADIAGAWRQMLGGQDGNPFSGFFQGMPGAFGAATVGWPDQVRPFVDAILRPLRQQASGWFGQPGLGPAREHQQRLQALAAAWQEWEERNEEFNALLSRIGKDAFARFERLLGQQETPEQRLATARALFDLWIDAAEEAWSEAALSEEYQNHYAALTNALMRVRKGLQHEIERISELLGLPGRTEVDSVHRKVAELERTVRELRRAAGLKQGAARAVPATAPKRPRKARPAAATAPEPMPAGKPEAKVDSPKVAPARPAPTAKTAKAAKAKTKQAAKPAPKKAGGKVAKQPAKKTVKTAATPRPRAAAARAAAPAARAEAKPAKASTPATSTAKREAPASATRKTRAAAAQPAAAAKKPARKAAAASTSRPAPAAKTAAAPTPRARKGQATQPASGAQVVSIKDWVSRNLGEAKADGRRGGRGR